MFGFLNKLLARKKRNPRETTGDFKQFAQSNAARVHDRISSTGRFPLGVTYERLLARFIRETGQSPFVGDESMAEARKFLLENM